MPVEYADRAVEWLAANETATDGPVGPGGFSRGGEFALLVATRHDVDCVVNWVGAGLLFDAVVRSDDLTVSDGSPDTSPWTVDGEPLPHPSRTDFEPGGNPTDAYRSWLAETPLETVRGAVIPLERVEAPVLLLSTGDDGVCPSRSLLSRAEERFDAADYGSRVEHRSYDGAGCDIGVPFLPTSQSPVGTVRRDTGRHRCRRGDAWPRVVDFFERNAEAVGGTRDGSGDAGTRTHGEGGRD